ncbi:MAG: ribonuclease III [Rickettsiales bacterium]|jgi:ribonuclease-3|nr:ribonuclease III [Rickettsiales bacterium]
MMLGYEFGDRGLLKRALRHSSAGSANNERLEFLGDRVLGLAVAAMLYAKFGSEAEGELAIRHAALVSARTLADIAAGIGLGDDIEVSRQEDRRGGRANANILADALEAVLGAVFLDGGFGAAQEVVEKLYEGRVSSATRPAKDAKTRLQEFAQKKFGAIPKYELAAKEGPEHAPVFSVSVSAGGRSAMGSGPSLHAAEAAAAGNLLELLGE